MGSSLMVSWGVFLGKCWWMAGGIELVPAHGSPGQLLHRLVGDHQPKYWNLPPNFPELHRFVTFPRGFGGEQFALGHGGPR